MLAPSPLQPVESLADDELRSALRDLERDRALLEATEAQVLVEFDRRHAFEIDGQLTAKSWMTHHTGIAAATAGSRVATARKLVHMPLLAEALAEGAVTVDHVRVLARCLKRSTYPAFVRDEAMLTGHAITFDADDFALVVHKWLLVNDPGQGSDEEPSVLHVSEMLEGRHRLDGELDVEDSSEFLAELEVLYDELWRQDQADHKLLGAPLRTPAELRAAAAVEMARRSSAAGDRDADPCPDDADDVSETAVTIRRRPRPRRPQFCVVVDPLALSGDRRGRAYLSDGGTELAQELLQRWGCDTAIGRVVMLGGSIPFDLGRLTYTASDGQRRMLEVRDGGCVVPGCKRKARWCEAHHVVPWPKGPTDIKNLVLLCRRHHRHVHRGIIKFLWNEPDHRWQLVRGHNGTPLYERPPPNAATLFN